MSVGATDGCWRAWRIAHAAAAGSASTRARPINFVEAVFFTWANPKGWATTLGALAAYTTVEGDALTQTSVIAAVLAGACFVSVVLWAAFGAAISRFLPGPRARTGFNWTMAGLLVVSLLPVLW